MTYELFRPPHYSTVVVAIQTIDLNGRLLPGRPDHGIYIKNGRKYRAD